MIAERERQRHGCKADKMRKAKKALTGGTEDDATHTHRVIVEFRDKGAGTEISIRMIFPSAVERNHVVNVYGAVQGLNDTTDRLSEYLRGLQNAGQAGERA